MEKTQKQWSFIVSILYYGLILGLFYLFMKYAFWLVSPFIFAFIIAALLQKPLKFFTKNKKVPSGVVGTVLVLLVFSAVIGLFVIGGVRLAVVIKDWISYFTARCTSLAEFFEIVKEGFLSLEIASMLPAEINNAITAGIDSVRDYVASGEIVSALTANISKLITPIGSVISTVPSILIGVIVSIITTCFMTPTFDDIKEFIFRQFSEKNREKAVRGKNIVVSSVGKMIKAYACIICITTAELLIGLGILKLIGVFEGDHLLLICFAIALIDIVPVLGTGTVVIPWSLYSFVTGNISMGIGLLVIYAAITVIRQVIEPKLVAGQVGISPVVTIMAMFLGIRIFGAIGIFIVPLLVIVINILNKEGVIHLFKNSNKDDEPETNNNN